jgi:hypothetical protein
MSTAKNKADADVVEQTDGDQAAEQVEQPTPAADRASDERQRAAEKRAAAVADARGGGAAPAGSYLAGLQAERLGYVQRGLDDSVAEVDAEIARVTGKA